MNELKYRIICSSAFGNDALKDEYTKSEHIIKERKEDVPEWHNEEDDWRYDDYNYYFVGTAEDMLEYARQIQKNLIFIPKSRSCFDEDMLEIYDYYRE